MTHEALLFWSGVALAVFLVGVIVVGWINDIVEMADTQDEPDYDDEPD
jgi:uncharacterized membrane protein